MDKLGISEFIIKLHNSIFDGSGTMASGIFGYVDYIIKYMLAFAGALMLILVGTKVIKYFANPSETLDPYVLVRPILVLAALTLYTPLVKTLLIEPVNIITAITEDAGLYVTGSASVSEFENTYVKGITNIQDTSTNPDGSKGDGIYDILQISPAMEFIHMMIYFIATIIAGYIMLRQLVYKAIYLILGALVLPLSLVPGNDGIVKKWFLSFFSILMWIPILKIIQTIIIMIHLSISGGEWKQVLMSVALQVVMIFAVLKVPSYADILVSPENGSSTGMGFGIFSSMGGAAKKHLFNPIHDRMGGKAATHAFNKIGRRYGDEKKK